MFGKRKCTILYSTLSVYKIRWNNFYSKEFQSNTIKSEEIAKELTKDSLIGKAIDPTEDDWREESTENSLRPYFRTFNGIGYLIFGRKILVREILRKKNYYMSHMQV